MKTPARHWHSVRRFPARHSPISPAFRGAPLVNAASGDPYLWLEDIHGARALEWVHAQNAVTKKAFMETPEFTATAASRFRGCRPIPARSAVRGSNAAVCR